MSVHASTLHLHHTVKGAGMHRASGGFVRRLRLDSSSNAGGGGVTTSQVVEKHDSGDGGVFVLRSQLSDQAAHLPQRVLCQ